MKDPDPKRTCKPRCLNEDIPPFGYYEVWFLAWVVVIIMLPIFLSCYILDSIMKCPKCKKPKKHCECQKPVTTFETAKGTLNEHLPEAPQGPHHPLPPRHQENHQVDL